MALLLVAGNLTAADVMGPQREISFPDSVLTMMRGELVYPAGGFPPEAQQRILKGARRRGPYGRHGSSSIRTPYRS